MSDNLGTSRAHRLLRRIAAGDEQAFADFFHLYHAKVYTYCLTLIKHRHLAEEAVQDVMLKVWGMGDELQHVLNADAFIRTITRNRAIDLMRAETSRKRINDIVGSESALFSEDNDEHIQLVETRRILNEAIDSLPQQQKTAYLLAEDGDLNGPEIAERMGLTTATVHTHLKLAKRKIRTYLRNHMDLPALFFLLHIL